MTKEEQKKKYSAFIAEVSEILGLGKPVDILKLCMITDRFFKPYQKRIAELEAENEQIKNSDTLCKLIGEQKRKITELEQQVEKMKCCKNCENEDDDSWHDSPCDGCENYIHWKLRR